MIFLHFVKKNAVVISLIRNRMKTNVIFFLVIWRATRLNKKNYTRIDLGKEIPIQSNIGKSLQLA